MDRRLVRFIVVACAAFLLTTLLQPWLFPKRPVANNPAAVNQQQPGDDTPSDTPADNGVVRDPADQSLAANVEQQPADDTDPATQPQPPKVAYPNRLVSLGQFGQHSPDKLVATVNSRGAAIHRIELNAREKNGRLRFRDLDFHGGYIGQLELTDHPNGCQVNCVTAGTPAAEAGISVGDVLTRFGNVQLKSADQFFELLQLIDPPNAIELTVTRGADAQTLTLQIPTQQKPLQVLGPASGMAYDPDAEAPESMLLTLRRKTTGVWPELDERMRTADWQTQTTEIDGRPAVEFTLDIDAPAIENSAAAEPAADDVAPVRKLRVTKRYWLAPPTANTDFDPNYHLLMDIQIQNLSNETQAVSFEIMGPTNTNIEGWWYQNKIHGRSSALMQIAGARDIVSSNLNRPFVFWGGPEIVKNHISSAPELQEVFNTNVTPPEQKAMRYVGVDTLYFSTMLMPHTGEHPIVPDPATTFRPYSAFTHVLVDRNNIGRNARLQRSVDLTFRLFSDQIELQPATADSPGGYRQTFEVFAGPKEAELLSKYGMSDLITYGWFAWISRPLIGFLRFFYGIFGNYGIAIVLLTVLVRLIIFPISRRAQMNAAKHAKMMQVLQPEIKKIQEKYKDNLERRARAQNELFKKYNYSPLSMFGGCLLMFLQLPIFIGLYRGLSVDIALRGQPLIPGWRWCSNLAGPDQLLYWKDWMPFGLANEQGLLGPFLNILPLLTVVLFVLQTKLFSPPAADEQQKMAQRVMTITMGFMGFLFFKVPSGLCIYFITSSVWGILERQFIPKPQLPEHLAQLEAGGVSNNNERRRTAQPAPGANLGLTNDKERDARRKRDRDRERRRRDNQ